jgi:hypothetical protein
MAPRPVIQMLDIGVDLTATETSDKTALHHLFDNPDMELDTILQFLRGGEDTPFFCLLV